MAADKDPTNPHDLAVDAQQDITKLATMLAHAGASPQAVAQLTKMSEVLGQVVKILGAGPALPGQEQPPQAGPPQAGPPAPGPAQPPQAGPPAPGPAQPPQASPATIHAATQHLHAAMQASAQQRR